MPDHPFAPGVNRAEAYPGPARAWYVTVVLMLTMALSYVDRTILSLLVVPIQADLGATDTQMGILLGPAFVLLYSLMGLPVGHLVDRANRRNILIAGVLVWTAGTLASGLAHSFDTLLVARSIVGAGEACVVPCAFSIVGDYFPAERRGRAIGVVSTGISIGAGTALFGGGLMLRVATRLHDIAWPLVGTLAPWQLVFVGCALPGLAMLLMLLTVAEPHRHGTAAAEPGSTARAFGGFLWRNGRTVGIVLVAYILFALIQYGLTAWAPTMLTRRLHLPTADAGFAYGSVVVIVSPLSALAGGFWGDAMSRRRPDGRLRMAASVAPLFVPGTLLATLSPDLPLVILGMCLISFSGTIIGTSVYATMQELAPGQYRGRMLALYALMAGLLGMMLGAPSIAFVTDHVLGDPMKLHLSMLTVCASGAAIAFALFCFGLPGYRRMRTAAQGQLE